jgi:hypothetical protein
MRKVARVLMPIVLIMALFMPLAPPPRASVSPTSASSPVSVASAQDRLVDANAAYAALESNLEAIGAKKISTDYGVYGSEQVIGIVDTGVDPLIPGFYRQGGSSKIRSWYDATSEGVANILGRYHAENGYLSVGELKLKVTNLRSLSNTYLVGLLPSSISNEFPVERKVYFVVFDPLKKGVFEAVAIDTDSDLAFGNEATLYRFDREKKAATVQLDSSRAVSLAVAGIENNGEKVTFGFDLHGHGTGMASIISGYSQGNGGVTPWADLIVAKVISSTGRGDWYNIIQGVQYCLDNGAGVVLIGAVPQAPITGSAWETLQRQAAAKGAHLVIPAGNNGPGAGTVTFSAFSDALVVASGYYPASTAQALFGKDYASDYWYPYSSCGPDAEGNRGVHISAPAIAAVPTPGHHDTLQFALMEGTSVSAAYTAGAISLLRQGAIRFGAKPLAAALGLLEGATELDGISPVEQGYGRIDLSRAWSLVAKGIADPRLKLAHKWNGYVAGGGLWIKDTTLGAFPLWIDNFAPSYRQVELKAAETWLTCQSGYLNMAPISQRDTIVYGSEELPPGFYSAELLADDSSTAGTDSRMVVTMSVPDRFSLDGKAGFDITLDSRHPVSRRFIAVPVSVQAMSLSMQSKGTGARFAIYSPDGFLVEQGWLDASRKLSIGLPKQGLWQVCFFQDIQDDSWGPASIRVDAKLEGVSVAELGITGDGQNLVINSDTNIPVNFRFTGPTLESQWRDRRSMLISTDRSTVLSLPEIEQSDECISIRFGTSTGNVLRAYLYYFDESTGKWTELEKAMTNAMSTGEIYLRQPQPGKYLAYIEAYSSRRIAYAEVDSLVVKPAGDSQKVPLRQPVGSLRSGSTMAQVALGNSGNAPRTAVIRTGEDQRIVAVFDRYTANLSELPVVQVIGGQNLKTVKAWSRGAMDPVDIALTIGNTTYQLHRGQVTARIPNAPYAKYRLPGENGMFMFPIDTGGPAD